MGGVFRPTMALLSWRPLGIVPAVAGVSAGSGSLPSAFASVASVVSSPVSCLPTGSCHGCLASAMQKHREPKSSLRVYC